jgi:UvrD/REP helicase N-terminal domain/PD-(D/E)XK nuclease superfamily
MSSEQLQVVDACANGNCVVDSVAGSGKTTTCLLIAESNVSQKNLLLTYNSKLKLETRARVVARGIKNMEVHSFHSFCVKHYDPVAYDDVHLHRVVADNVKPRKTFQYDRIILDESQDLTPLLYKIFKKLYADNGTGLMVVFGDRKQSIYEFRGADSRYLTLADAIYPGSWKRLQLSTTYRLTRPMAEFVNKVMLKEDRLVAVKKSSVVPDYFVCDAFSPFLFDVLMSLLKTYKPEDIFLVAPSIRNGKSPIRELENLLVKQGIPCFVPVSDDMVVTDDLLVGKIALSTIHQTKGMERKVVLVFGFDASYFKFYKVNADVNVCPDELYVAGTRATERLIFVHHYKNGFLPFLCRKELSPYIVYQKEEYKTAQPDENHSSDRRMKSVTELLRYLKTEVLHRTYSKLKRTTIVEPTEKLAIESKIEGDDTTEFVSHITGATIPIYYEYRLTGRITMLEKLKNPNQELENVPRYHHIAYLNQAHLGLGLRGLQEIKDPTAAELLFIVNCWNAETSGYLSQVKQITNYDWLTIDMLEETCKRMNGCVVKIQPTAFQFEKLAMKPPDAVVKGTTTANVKSVHPDPYPELRGRVLYGYADMVTSNNEVVEIKCVAALTMEHYLQLALYMYLNDSKTGYLFNVLTGELVRVQCSDLNAIVYDIIGAKYGVRGRMTDEEFMTSHR